MRLPGPSDLFTAASTVREGVSSAYDEITGLVELMGRGAALMTQAESLAARADTLIGRGEALLDRADLLLDQTAATVDASSRTVLEAKAATDGAALAVAETHLVLDRTRSLLDPAEELARRAFPLAAILLPVGERLAPAAQRLADSTQDVEIEALVRMVDRLPQLTQHLEDDVLPMLGTLSKVGPDVHDILAAVEDLSLAIKGMPGMGLLRRRGERIEEEDEAAGEHA